MEAQPALVGPDGAVHLDAETPVDVDLAVVVDPGDPEDDHPLGLGHTLEDLGLAVLGPGIDHRGQARVDLAYGLDELRFTGVLVLDRSYDRIDVRPHGKSSL